MSSPPTVYQVSELSNEMRRLMETSYPEIWIEGELSSLSTPASGHLYFSLKDEQSQLRCAMFKGRAGVSRYRPKVGDLVRVRAKISVYTARGDLQCIVQHMEEAGEGLLQRRFEELKQRLNQQGLFDHSHKQAIPSFCDHIGLITSPSGAAVKDLLSTLSRRCPGIPVTIYPAVVQGDTAAASLRAAIGDAVQHARCDVLVISRGGGSLEDLWCFNDEQLARAIFDCPIPIVSGVGHEVDVTIADLVADLRAPTPTAAAELISPDISHLVSQVDSLGQRLPRALRRQIQQSAQTVDLTGRQLVHPRQQLSMKRRSLLKCSETLNAATRRQLQSRQTALKQQRLRLANPQRKLEQLELHSQALRQRLRRAQLQQLTALNIRFNSLGEQLNLVSPLATLDRGFAIARDENANIIRAAAQVEVKQNIELQLADGELLCTVDQIK